MFYYSYFSSQGRDVLAAALGTQDPFELAPYEIVERVLAGGESPLVDCKKADLWRAMGQVYEVRLARRNFVVAVCRNTQEINVQEIRADAYDRADDRGPLIDQDMEMKTAARSGAA